MPVSSSPIRQVSESIPTEKPKPPPASAKPKVQSVASQEQLMSEMNNRLKQRQENGTDGKFSFALNFPFHILYANALP